MSNEVYSRVKPKLNDLQYSMKANNDTLKQILLAVHAFTHIIRQIGKYSNRLFFVDINDQNPRSGARTTHDFVQYLSLA